MIIWGPQVGTGKAMHAGVTRRVLLVIGGVTLLAGYSHDPAGGTAEAVRTRAAHPTPVPERTRSAHRPSASARLASKETARKEMARKDTARRDTARKDTARTRLARPGSRAAGRGPGRNAEDLPMFHVADGPKRIALTIDDGPSPVYTPQLLRLLDQYRVTATFSMIGLQVASHPGVAREVAAAGHQIANHTWAHLDLAALPPVAIADQINRATGAIHAATGRVPTLFRAPYGAWSLAVLQYCSQAAMTPLDWSVDPRDWSRPGVAAIAGNIMRNTGTGSIILEHDGGGNRSQTVAALKIVLPRLLAAGYRFTTP
jgi:peptidoglycan/xylan/chitin deacetylase (PgdA/CDA1 family)